MATHSLITLSDATVTALTPNGTHSGMDITIQNVNDTGYIYIGATSTLSSTNYGFRLVPNQAIAFELPGQDDLYAIAETNGLKIGVIKTSLESQDG